VEIGDKVQLCAPREAWYSGYGSNPVHVIGTEEIGIVQAVDVPAVRKVSGRKPSYNVARFGSWQVDFYEEDVIRK
jgi:hypothetical protein